MSTIIQWLISVDFLIALSPDAKSCLGWRLCNAGQWETYLQVRKRGLLCLPADDYVELCLLVVFGFVVACHHLALWWCIHFQRELHWNILTVTFSPLHFPTVVSSWKHICLKIFLSTPSHSTDRLTYALQSFAKEMVVLILFPHSCQKSWGEKLMSRFLYN